MPIFQYKAKNKSAETVLGQINANNKKDAIEKVHHLGLTPVIVSEGNLSVKERGKTRIGHVKSKEVFLFSRQLVSLLKAGIPILRALELLSQQTKNKYFAGVIQNIHFNIKGGRSFSDCLAEYPKIFSFLYVTMVKAGEESGTLKETISSVSEHIRRQNEFVSRVKTAMAYPLLMGIFGIGTIFFILTCVMPQISELFISLDQDLPWQTVFIMKLSAFFVEWGGWLLFGAMALFAIIKKSDGLKNVRAFKSQLRLGLPFVGSFLVRFEMARFCRTLGLLLRSGVSIVRAIELAIPVVANELIQNQLKRCQEELVAGRSFGETLRQTKMIPEMVGHLISVGEESGSLVSTLYDIAENYEQETSDILKVMTSLLEPLMIITVGAVIGFIVIAMLLPIFQINLMVK